MVEMNQNINFIMDAHDTVVRVRIHDKGELQEDATQYLKSTLKKTETKLCKVALKKKGSLQSLRN